MEINELLNTFVGPAGVLGFLAVWLQNRQIKREVKPNHGSSLNDSVRRIEKNQEQLQADVRELVKTDRETRRLIGHEIGEDRRRLDRIETHLFSRWKHR